MDQKTEAVFEKISEWQQLGYDAWKKSNRPRAVEFWTIGWNLVVELMQSGQFATIEDLDKAYHGRQSIANWVTDFSELLYQTGLTNPSELPASIAFNRQVLEWSSKKDNINSFNRRRMIADSIFKISGPEAGDAVFSQYLNEFPRWGWGWANWAEQHEPVRAEQILRQALQVADLDHRDLVQMRLRDSLIRQGRSIEADSIVIESDSVKKAKKWLQR